MARKAQGDNKYMTRSFRIRADQNATLIKFAKENDRSVSSALRFILDDWVDLKKAAIRAAAPVKAEVALA